MATLLPPAQPVGVFPFYTQHTNEIALQIREKKLSLTGDDFDITDAVSGGVMFHVDGKAFSLHGRKELFDNRGKHLFTLRKELFRIHTTFEGRDPATDSTLFTVKSSFSFGTKLHATYINPNTGAEEKLLLKGDFFDRKAEITTEAGQVVGRIGRQFLNAGELLFGQQTYILTVAPGVDAALLAAICICLDEKANESSNSA